MFSDANQITIENYFIGDKSLDTTDPDCLLMPPEFWDGAMIGKYYRPVKTQI